MSTTGDLERATEALEAAIAESTAARQAADATRGELVSERRWRRWTAVAGAVLAAVLIAGMALVGVLLHQANALQHDNHRVLTVIEGATSPAGQRAQAVAVQGIIAQVVDQTDCRVRDDIALALHQAFPSTVVTLPATVTCPAYTP